MIYALGLLLAAQAAKKSEMLAKCRDGYDDWDSIDSDDWNFDEDWEDQIANGATDVYPAGFQTFTLGRYNDPPVCLFVPGSKDKKVEILIESPMENANLCITDAGYNGISNNEVGSVAVCGTGKIYACFTAAIAEPEEGEDADNFGFIVSCKEGCEDMDIDLLIRVRLSKRGWDQGKDGVWNDLEHWCEGERGNILEQTDGSEHMYYTYPSDLVPEEPSQYPFHITQIFGRNSGSQTKPHIWLVSVVAVLGLACLYW